ncbi:RNA 2',3'-cyclic phosphodiesterase [soil metagenome]
MRLFVAVFPPPEVREEASRTARRLLPDDRIRWSRPGNVHLTLKFLGGVDEERLDELRTVLEDACAAHAPFEARLAGLGAFPSARRARIIWAGAGAGSEQLRSLAADVDAALSYSGFERETRPYEPHLTLGRVRGRPVSLDLPKEADDGLLFEVRRIELTESTLTDKGPVYRTIEDFVLFDEKS